MNDVTRKLGRLRAAMHLFVGTSLLLPAMATAQPGGTTVRTTGGTIEGVADKDLMIFKGVPLGEAPVGPLRWTDAKPAKPWSGVRKADSFAAPCMQTLSPMMGGAAPSEDCLYLNVWTPGADVKAKRPVMVVIYGGGFTMGTASPPQTDGSGLARKGAVVVALPYRVGTLGYMAHPELSAESPHHASGNYAMSDIVLGLKWVRDNAASFGGDPGNVTVYGCSAGGHMSSYLITSPAAAGLFRRAIPESGAMFARNALNTNMASLKDNEAIGVAIQKQLGAASLADMRRIPAEKIVASQSAGGEGIHNMALPSVDGFWLPLDPATAFKQGKYNKVDMITGWGANEGAVFKPVWQMIDTSAKFERMLPVLAPGAADLFTSIYPHRTDAEARKSAIAFVGDNLFGYHNWKLAQEMVRHEQPTWIYHYERPTSSPILKMMAGDLPSEDLAGLHCGNDAYSNNNVAPGPWFGQPSESDYKLAETMSSYWVNFARTGNPNGPGLPEWPRYDGTPAGKALRMNDYVTVGPVPSSARMLVLDRMFDAPRSASK